MNAGRKAREVKNPIEPRPCSRTASDIRVPWSRFGGSGDQSDGEAAQRPRKPARPPRPDGRASSVALLALEQADDEQQHHRAHEGRDERADQAVAAAESQQAEDPATDHAADDADDDVAEDAEAVKRNWEQIKLKEGKGKKTVLSGVPKALPAMVKAMRMQEKTAQFNFDWENKEQVWDKVAEELEEYKESVALADQAAQEEEFGDLLFSLINYARWQGIDPEMALEKTNRKFKNRFEYLEREAGDRLGQMSLAEMEAIWQSAKTKV